MLGMVPVPASVPGPESELVVGQVWHRRPPQPAHAVPVYCLVGCESQPTELPCPALHLPLPARSQPVSGPCLGEGRLPEHLEVSRFLSLLIGNTWQEGTRWCHPPPSTNRCNFWGAFSACRLHEFVFGRPDIIQNLGGNQSRLTHHRMGACPSHPQGGSHHFQREGAA